MTVTTVEPTTIEHLNFDEAPACEGDPTCNQTAIWIARFYCRCSIRLLCQSCADQLIAYWLKLMPGEFECGESKIHPHPIVTVRATVIGDIFTLGPL